MKKSIVDVEFSTGGYGKCQGRDSAISGPGRQSAVEGGWEEDGGRMGGGGEGGCVSTSCFSSFLFTPVLLDGL